VSALQDNVVYDNASEYAWDELHETAFLERVFFELEQVLGAEFGDYRFYVVSSHDPDVRPASLEDSAPRKVLLFVSDESQSVPEALRPHYTAIFKSYLPYELPDSNVFPFPLGYLHDVHADPPKPMAERSVSVFFSGSLGPARLPLYRALHPVYKRLPTRVFERALSASPRLVREDLSNAVPGSLIRFTRAFKEGLSAADYGAVLADARIALCPHGARAPETFRHVEAARAGAVVVSPPLPDTHFNRSAPFVIVPSWAVGVRRARELLGDLPALEALQRDTLEWWDGVGSESATARYVADRLRAISSTA
jgi:hypothetical protein